MNKYMLLGLLFGFLYLMSMVAASIGFSSSELPAPGYVEGATRTGVLHTIAAFWAMVTFTMPGVPFFINFIFIIISIIIVYMIVDILKDLVPLT